MIIEALNRKIEKIKKPYFYLYLVVFWDLQIKFIAGRIENI